mgnify:CR=1 FL=1
MCGALCLAVGPMLTHARPDVSDGIPTRVLKTATTSHSMSPLFVPWFIWAPASGPRPQRQAQALLRMVDATNCSRAVLTTLDFMPERWK